MSTVTVKKDDLGVLFTDTLQAAGVDFTGVASALFLLRDMDSGTTSSHTATTANPATGSIDISYTTAAGELAAVASYRQEWELTFSGGAVLTFPNDGYNEVHVIADLN